MKMLLIMFATILLGLLGIAAWIGPPLQKPVTFGGVCGWLIAASGLPAAWKLPKIGNSPNDQAEFWSWWGGAFFVRMALLVVFAKTILRRGENSSTALLSMTGVYIVTFFCETAWLALAMHRKQEPGARA